MSAQREKVRPGTAPFDWPLARQQTFAGTRVNISRSDYLRNILFNADDRISDIATDIMLQHGVRVQHLDSPSRWMIRLPKNKV